MAENCNARKALSLSDGSAARTVERAEGSNAISGEQPSGATTAPTAREAATPLSSLYQDLLESRGHMEEELHRRALALATLAHEIKNPLAIISGYVEMLLSKKVGSLTGRQEKILGETRSNCERLQKFAQEFLAYSALTFKNASAGLRLESWDLTVCLSEVCGFWLDKFSAKGVALYFRANPDVPPFKFDYYKVQTVVSNLLENSLKFTPSGGTVWLAAEMHLWERRVGMSNPQELERRKSSSAGAAAVRAVIVADSGKGIAPEFYQEVFEDFFRAPGDEIQPQGADWGWPSRGALFSCTKGRSGWKANSGSAANSVSCCR